jgi:glycosyltransferase involved in cell wall biosynthesis
MRILLTANASYVPPRGGATRSNLVWLEIIASHGHECRIVAPALSAAVVGQQAQEEEIAREWHHAPGAAGIDCYERRGVTVHAVAERARLVTVLRDQIREWEPDWVLVSSEDLGHALLHEAARSAPGRVVYLAHTPQFFPFGHASWNPDSGATELVRASAAIVAIGHFSGVYITEHTGREPAIVHPPIYGTGPYPNFASFDRGMITMINPCAVKGISIFLALADRFPQHPFGVLPGWGTTSADRAELARRPNITLLPNYKDIEDFLRQTRVLLMPSLWLEGFGLSVMEAKLRGIPTISSDSGGLKDANAGAGVVVPVRGIQEFAPEFDEHAMPKPVLPANDVEPWAAALERILTDPPFYEEMSVASRRFATGFVESIRPARIVEFLLALRPGEPAPAAPPCAEALSPERRALLLKRLREKAAGRDSS